MISTRIPDLFKALSSNNSAIIVKSKSGWFSLVSLLNAYYKLTKHKGPIAETVT